MAPRTRLPPPLPSPPLHTHIHTHHFEGTSTPHATAYARTLAASNTPSRTFLFFGGGTPSLPLPLLPSLYVRVCACV